VTRINSDDIRDYLDYDPSTGKFWWKDEAGTLSTNGYRYIRVRGKMRLAHRMAWAIYYGEEPPKGTIIDHINGDRQDNRIANLRLADFSQNGANARLHAHNTSGYKGVAKVVRKGKWTGRWQASITVRNKQRSLGTHFRTPEAAHEAYLKAAREHHGEFANGGSVGHVAAGVERDWLFVATPRFGNFAP
jgi:hypothetical protein